MNRILNNLLSYSNKGLVIIYNVTKISLWGLLLYNLFNHNLTISIMTIIMLFLIAITDMSVSLKDIEESLSVMSTINILEYEESKGEIDE